MDNHCSHKSLRIYEFCRENFISVVTIPPHTSHRLQPLDVSFYSALKTAVNRECDVFIKTKHYAKITPYDLASLFNKAYGRVATIEKAVFGFKSTGIFSLNPEKFTDDDFAPVTHKAIAMPIIDIDESITTGDQKNSDHLNQKAISKAKTDVPQPVDDITKPGPSRLIEPSPLTPIHDDARSGPLTEVSTAVKQVTKQLFRDLTSIPLRNPSVPNKRKQHSEIMTNTPFKFIFESSDKKREKLPLRKRLKKEIRRKTPKRKKMH
ncbi:uncharacterized protein LOC126878665 [Diabrotica virgifera virgifera]|uniref:DDE-1 domain-containing protein n=1 Tax=Diabrotica virgifera virgifera TaxID=50390 RepID=A0ABM5JHQ1_DIAVI|nr:uncharacterized protein LOC126878665 [Diabrotica virgifera virgifera]